MTDDFAIEGEDAGYVPCLELAAALDAEEEGAISGLATGFVARDAGAAALPAEERAAIVGSGVGFVPKPCCDEPMRKTEVWEVIQHDGVEIDRTGIGLFEGNLSVGPGGIGFFGWWNIYSDPPLFFQEIRYFMRFQIDSGPDAVRYSITGQVRPGWVLPDVVFNWEIRAWDWDDAVIAGPTRPESDTLGPVWDEGILVHAGTCTPGDDPWVEFEFPAIFPRRCWLGFRNVSLTGEWVEPDLSVTERTRALGGSSTLYSGSSLGSNGYDSWQALPCG